MKQLNVFFQEKLAGELFYVDGKFQFNYLPEQQQPISVRMPIAETTYSDKLVRPFFANILPEGNIRKLLALHEKISEHNDFLLLEKNTAECSGAIGLYLPGEVPTNQPGYTKLSPEQVKELFNVKANKPLLVQHKELRLSLAGAQNKIPVLFRAGQLALPAGNAPSSHVFKPQNSDFPGLVFNEAFCADLARNIGLEVPAIKILESNNNYAYLIERFDRQNLAAGKIARVHQEDFCQVLAVMPENKYQAEGGPDLISCFNVFEQYSTSPLVDRQRLLELTCFNYLIGNADAHAKNISLLHDVKGIKLAPFYDLVCTLAYDFLSEKAAMKIGGEYRLNRIERRHWERFALEVNLKPGYVLETLAKIKTKCLKEIELLIPKYAKYKSNELNTVITIIRKRCS